MGIGNELQIPKRWQIQWHDGRVIVPFQSAYLRHASFLCLLQVMHECTCGNHIRPNMVEAESFQRMHTEMLFQDAFAVFGSKYPVL